MLKTGIKKELMFFTRSFKMGGIIIAAIALAIASPILMKFSGMMINSLDNLNASDPENGVSVSISLETASDREFKAENMVSMDPGDFMSVFGDENLALLGILSAFGDTTSTFLLVFMIVTMSSAGGELKKRSIIIPQNAGLSTKLYVLPKFLVYPAAAALFSFLGIISAGLVTKLVFSSTFDLNIMNLLLIALTAAVYDAFMVTLYFTLGLCTSRAGIATIILYGGGTILSLLFTSFGADKFHPFALKNEAQNILMSGESDISNIMASGEADMVNIWGSIGVSLLIMILCYFITVFVISAKRVDNRGGEEINL